MVRLPAEVTHLSVRTGSQLVFQPCPGHAHPYYPSLELGMYQSFSALGRSNSGLELPRCPTAPVRPFGTWGLGRSMTSAEPAPSSASTTRSTDAVDRLGKPDLRLCRTCHHRADWHRLNQVSLWSCFGADCDCPRFRSRAGVDRYVTRQRR